MPCASELPKEDSVAENKNIGGTPCEDGIKERHQETITSCMRSARGIPTVCEFGKGFGPKQVRVPEGKSEGTMEREEE